MAWLQQQSTRERPDTFTQTVLRQTIPEVPCNDGADHTFPNRTAARTLTALWTATTAAIAVVKPDECAKYFNACGYEFG